MSGGSQSAPPRIQTSSTIVGPPQQSIKGKYTRLSALYRGSSSDVRLEEQTGGGDGDVLAGTSVKPRYSDAVVASFKGQGLLYAHDEMYGRLSETSI
jgi:hypothetical protein